MFLSVYTNSGVSQVTAIGGVDQHIYLSRLLIVIEERRARQSERETGKRLPVLVRDDEY
jgi:hypothetical protein